MPSVPLGKPSNPVICWPEQRRTDSGGGRDLSSHKFRCTFVREDTARTAIGTPGSGCSSDRFEPQPLSIQLAISRNGRMFRLGTAEVLLSGEEDGRSSVNVPVRNCNPALAPKSSKFKVSLNGGSRDKVNVIPMMKLKGDTIKCGLDPGATLRVLVHVSDPLGESLDISPNLSVTMVSRSPTRHSEHRQSVKNKPRQMTPNRRDAPAAGIHLPALPPTPCTPTSNGSQIGWEYVVKSTPVAASDETWNHNAVMIGTTDDNKDPLLRVISLRDSGHCESERVRGRTYDMTDDGHDYSEGSHDDTATHDYLDEPSCTSSAYMSFAVEDRQKRYPRKYRSTRSRSTATTTTTLSEDFTFVSELTEAPSWLSQTGIEVIPWREDAAAVAELPENSRLRYYEEEEETNGLSSRVSRLTDLSLKKTSWRQRLVCGMPGCGSTSSIDAYRAAGGDDADLLLTVAAGENCHQNLVGRCDPMEMPTGVSYWTDDDATLAEYEDGGSESSDSSAGFVL